MRLGRRLVRQSAGPVSAIATFVLALALATAAAVSQESFELDPPPAFPTAPLPEFDSGARTEFGVQAFTKFRERDPEIYAWMIESALSWGSRMSAEEVDRFRAEMIAAYSDVDPRGPVGFPWPYYWIEVYAERGQPLVKATMDAYLDANYGALNRSLALMRAYLVRAKTPAEMISLEAEISYAHYEMSEHNDRMARILIDVTTENRDSAINYTKVPHEALRMAERRWQFPVHPVSKGVKPVRLDFMIASGAAFSKAEEPLEYGEPFYVELEFDGDAGPSELLVPVTVGDRNSIYVPVFRTEGGHIYRSRATSIPETDDE